MRSLGWLLVALATVLVAAPATASAWTPPGDQSANWIGAANRAGLTVAAQTWGAPPCGTPTVETSSWAGYAAAHPEARLPDGRPPSGATVEPLAWADESRCAIVISSRARIRTKAKRCHIIVHEWGHLAHFRDDENSADPAHSHNPASVMFAATMVTEGRVNTARRPWRASGAFAPCYAATGEKSWSLIKRKPRRVVYGSGGG